MRSVFAHVAALLSALLLSSSFAAAQQINEKDQQCATCKQLVNATREELKQHAGDAKEYLLAMCENSPAIVKDQCLQIAKTAGDAIKDVLKQAYETLTEETMCAMFCSSQEATVDFRNQMNSIVTEAAGALSSALGKALEGPLDVVCSTCKATVVSTKKWIKEHQMDVRGFMYKTCDTLKDVDPVKCKETADQVADEVEAALQKLYDSLDEEAVCAPLCPTAPRTPTMWQQLHEAVVVLKKALLPQ